MAWVGGEYGYFDDCCYTEIKMPYENRALMNKARRAIREGKAAGNEGLALLLAQCKARHERIAAQREAERVERVKRLQQAKWGR